MTTAPGSFPPDALIDRAWLDSQFQTACQQYVHGTGSSRAIAAAALQAVGAQDLLGVAEAALWEDDGLSCADALRAAIAKARGEGQ